jgi:hypothetical protein
MAYDPSGEWGLRRRVRIAYEVTGSYTTVAANLGVDESVIRSFLDNPDYIPSPADIATIISNLANVTPSPIWDHSRHVAGGGTVAFMEMAVWTEEALAGIQPPPGAVSFLWHYNGDQNSDPDAEGTLKSSPSFGLPEHDPKTVADDLVAGDYGLLRTLVWFIPGA